MKNLVYILLVLVFVVSYSCDSEPNTQKTEVAKEKRIAKLKGANSKCKFEKELYDLGTIQQGEIVKYTMKFTNTGNDFLVINSARASCGCTVPKWTKEPIAKGEEGQLEVTFDSSGRSGIQNKSIKLLTNSVDKYVLVRFTAKVVVNDN